MKTSISLVLITFSLVCLALLPRAQAVSPAPDGGYPGGNTAEGQNALLSLTSGTYNTAVGFFSLSSTTTSSFNTGIGAGALLSNVAGPLDTPNGVPPGAENTATGAGALLSNSTGAQNTANGAFALFSNTESNFNTAIGARALFLNTIGSENTATGASALQLNTTGNFNVANGGFALLLNASGNNNVAIGDSALINNTSGNNNVAIGGSALSVTTGSGNIAIGFQAGSLVGSSGNVIAIGSPGDDVDNSCFIANIRDAQTQNADAIPVLVDSAGQLGTASSSQRFKKEIKPMDKISESILALKPVTFYYKNDKTDTPQFGLIAEEVAKVNPALVVRDKSGEIYTVRYEAVNAMLLNEFLKEHQKVEDQDRKLKEQQATIAQLKKDLQATGAQQQKQIEALAAGLQKVSAQLEVTKPAPQTVLNSQ
jgi:hypothetical protein